MFTAQNYHDVHNVPNIDIAAFNKSVFDALKPGGVFIVWTTRRRPDPVHVIPPRCIGSIRRRSSPKCGRRV